MSGNIQIQSVGPLDTAAGTQTINITLPFAVAPLGAITSQALAAGNNTIAIVAGATYVIIEPPATNSQVMILKGANGDQGFALQSNCPSIISTTVVGSFVINAAAPISQVVFTWL